jgi:DNA-binding GntR family transcriptional regulator
VRILDDLRDQTALVSAAAWTRTSSWRREADEHRAILAAALDGDADRARDLLRAHIERFVADNFPHVDLTQGAAMTVSRSDDAS